MLLSDRGTPHPIHFLYKTHKGLVSLHLISCIIIHGGKVQYSLPQFILIIYHIVFPLITWAEDFFLNKPPWCKGNVLLSYIFFIMFFL